MKKKKQQQQLVQQGSNKAAVHEQTASTAASWRDKPTRELLRSLSLDYDIHGHSSTLLMYNVCYSVLRHE